MEQRSAFNRIRSYRYMILLTIALVLAAAFGMASSFRWWSPQGARTIRSSKTHCDRNEFFLTQREERVKTLHLIGERHSGTRWMFQHLSDCFNTSVAVSEKLTRFKHWFQYEDENRVNAFEDRYVIALFRNPYDWVEMMRQVPYHSPRHKDMEWNDFVTTPWTMPRFGRDLLIVDANATKKDRNGDSRFCENNFYYNQVVPCVENSLVGDMHPLYEHEPFTGIPYQSILHLRRDKIVNFLSVEHYKGVKYFDAWKFEDILRHGSSQLVKQLEGVLGVAATCRPSNPTEPRTKRHKLEKQYVEWMKYHVDWNNSETLIGYHVTEYE